MKKLKAIILNTGLIIVGLSPIISNAQWNLSNSTVLSSLNGVDATIPANQALYSAYWSAICNPTSVFYNNCISSCAPSGSPSKYSGCPSITIYSNIKTSNNVGIKLNYEPTYALDVNGTIQANNITLWSTLTTPGFRMTPGAASGKVLTSDINGNASWQSPTYYSQWTNSGNDIKYTTGKVKIGSGNASPNGTTDYLLAVAGKVYCQEINVTQVVNWSDYVFKKDYKLSSLTDVEKYIKENGHLENVPSAEEVSKNGFKVGEMDATLLRKIEELTLYLLEQDKKISAQQKEMEILKAQIKK